MVSAHVQLMHLLNVKTVRQTQQGENFAGVDKTNTSTVGAKFDSEGVYLVTIYSEYAQYATLR